MCKARYITVWGDGSIISTNCSYDPKTSLIYDIETIDPGKIIDPLEEEYIEFENNQIPVCTQCHEHTLKNGKCFVCDNTSYN